MPVVPIRRNASPKAQAQPQRDPPDEPWALMAAAQMHAEGRLIEGNMKATDGQRTNR